MRDQCRLCRGDGSEGRLSGRGQPAGGDVAGQGVAMERVQATAARSGPVVKAYAVLEAGIAGRKHAALGQAEAAQHVAHGGDRGLADPDARGLRAFDHGDRDRPGAGPVELRLKRGGRDPASRAAPDDGDPHQASSETAASSASGAAACDAAMRRAIGVRLLSDCRCT